MGLYEVTNGYHGESYVRVYVWAESAGHALAMARERYTEESPERAQNLKVEFLFAADAPPFCTRSSDSGWPV